MTARLTRTEAKRLGIDLPAGRTTRSTARGPYHTRCVLCGEDFRTQASEDRHFAETTHPRYALVMEESC